MRGGVSTAILIALIAFSIVETVIFSYEALTARQVVRPPSTTTVTTSSTTSSVTSSTTTIVASTTTFPTTKKSGPLATFVNYSLEYAAGGWSATALTFLLSRRRSEDQDLFEGRGGGTRVEILLSLEVPRHRNEISSLTGVDWKEVDRNLDLLIRAGLVKVFAKTGRITIYSLTEKGEQILRELKAGKSHGSKR
jgi:DNA-binding transcriptional ArsR family regulator